MQALILSAGQGRRLLPFTEKMPKCLLTIQGKTILELQLNNLIRCGIHKINIVVGFGAKEVEKEIKKKFSFPEINTIYNPFYATSDNLISCWLAKSTMDSDFLLLNGDTIFEGALLQKVLDSAAEPITVTIDKKENYDLDDMKVITNQGLVSQIGKSIPMEQIKGEAIGIHLFKNQGPRIFKDALEDFLRKENANNLWYLSVIDKLSKTLPVGTCCIQGLKWAEIDYHQDLISAEKDIDFFRTRDSEF